MDETKTEVKYKFTPVVVYTKRAMCPKCKIEMEHKIAFDHKCPECGEAFSLDDKYPKLHYWETEGPD